MYHCGPTVYDRQHIGNLRPYVFADVLRRTITLWGYKTEQVINITDVGHLVSDADDGEDKIEKSARVAGRSAQSIAKEITDWWFEDLDALGIVRKGIQFPRATDYISEQIALIKALEEKSYAYRISDGVYFDTAKFKDYGKLGRIALAGQEARARVEENKEKKNPHDFALWKLSKPGEKRQQEWPSPWGIGFPGWHIECTAFIFSLLGKQIDIHTGGIDHIAIHHNNEIAQAEALTGKQYVRYWLHNEFITIEGKKVSKSLGNTIYLSQIVDRGFSPRALRYLYLTAHYRTPSNFTWEAIEGADQALKRLTRTYLELPAGGIAHEGFLDAFYGALANDLDTPKAVAEVWNLQKGEGAYKEVSPADKKASLTKVDLVLGLGLAEARPTQKLTVSDARVPEAVQALAKEREAARAEKDFARSDVLREEIEKLGFGVTDSAQGQELRKL